MSIISLTHKPLIIEKLKNPLRISMWYLVIEYSEVLIIDHPDCFGTMVKVYGSEDKVGYNVKAVVCLLVMRK